MRDFLAFWGIVLIILFAGFVLGIAYRDYQIEIQLERLGYDIECCRKHFL